MSLGSHNVKLFINYRREDTRHAAGRLYDDLTTHFGKDQIFIDIDQIEPGEDFVEAINRKVGSCDIAIVVIGRHWLHGTDASGKRRLDDEEDFVRMEIVAALQREIRVIPVLVDGAQMPRKHELPEALGVLSRRNAIELSDTRFHADVNRLIKAIERAGASHEQKALPSAAATASVAEPVKAGNSKSKDLRDTSEPPGTSKLSVAPVATVPKGGSAMLGADIEALVPPAGSTRPVADGSTAHISWRSRIAIIAAVPALVILGTAAWYLGHKREVPPEKAGPPRVAPSSELDKWLALQKEISTSTQAKKQVAVAKPAEDKVVKKQPKPIADLFYNNLSGGDWFEVAGYGYGWQPDLAASDPNWRPYTDGYWAYTELGWTWISYEDHGWATYHYGRWVPLADYGWLWFPGGGSDWGPSWVCWRTGGNYVGWAPLPPRGPGVVYEGETIGPRVDIEFHIGPAYYNFCEVRYIGEPVLRNYIAPPVQNITYINNTLNVTNITVKNNVVYNYGPNYEVLNAHSVRPIQRLNIEWQWEANLFAAAKSGTLTKVIGNKLVVAAPPKISNSAALVAPVRVKAYVAHPQIDVKFIYQQPGR
jgi:hypothetical protein